MLRRTLKSAIKTILRRIKQRRLNRYNKWLYRNERERYYRHKGREIPEKQVAKVSIVVPVYNPGKMYIEALLSSIFAQGYKNWELILADGSTQTEISDYIAELATHDVRIVYKKIKNEGIAGNTNAAIELSTGKYIAFMDDDDMLDPDAVAESVLVLEQHPEYGATYSDEDKLSEDGENFLDPHFKPGFSLDMLRNVNYITHFVVMRAEVVKSLKGIRVGFDGAQDYDFLLRAVDAGVKFAHIPLVLYHWRLAKTSTAKDFSVKKDVLEAGCRALDEHYERNGIHNVMNVPIEGKPGFYRPRYTGDKRVKKAIAIDVAKYNLRQREVDYMFRQFSNLDDVKTSHIEVGLASEIKLKNYDVVFNVNAPMIPKDDHQDILSMFELAREDGVAGVSPKITQHGYIVSMGSLALFKNTAKNDFFGSSEWVRDAGTTDLRACVKSSNRDRSGRSVVWTHCEFILLNTVKKLPFSKSDLESLENQNVFGVQEVKLMQTDYTSDGLEEER